MSSFFDRLVISIEGVTGVGKSTFLNELNRQLDRLSRGLPMESFSAGRRYDNAPQATRTMLHVDPDTVPLRLTTVPTPVEKQTNFFGYNLSSYARTNPTEHAFPFNVLVAMSHFEQQAEHPDAQVLISERSPQTTVAVFDRLPRNEEGLRSYKSLLSEYMVSAMGMVPHAYIYLRADPEIVQKRLGEGAEDVSLLQKFHDEWLDEMNPMYPGLTMGRVLRSNVFVVNCNGSIPEMLSNIPDVTEFIKQKAREQLTITKPPATFRIERERECCACMFCALTK
ncbi:deoxyguanosine kinase 1 [Anguillid herpesvirus 1]|uniref:Deoxyguanosine kinase 1 n=1 Tax=Anguillid herpesvirus 1 TaxID=150286 RepID=A0A8E5AJZ4_9VIRU|nr:deoxyguanosine kinase 1 [Anguillid herpesvirus 1]ADA57842.1 deoxyguanosine kinase 1 [Anguillid herpesvirus 1]QRM16372.1 deoxyguanosine kinase 1 [Anguillid herpesvirus 1]QRM16631.1 deoxyguanosine kinase 1 [Anguillid herpesvirus 1]QRM16894.1 deoxyguanosine kinase 1 [Anguillid herpesvirus 1]